MTDIQTQLDDWWTEVAQVRAEWAMLQWIVYWVEIDGLPID